MAGTGMCCASLEEPQPLMKMGLSMVLIGHINFLLGALVHGVVLRHINFHKQARAMEYAISNVVALTSGLVGIIVGILAILLSKNKKSKGLTWSLLTVGVVASLTAATSAIGLLVSMVRTILHDGRSLLTYCRFPDAIGYSSITNECPFDPTRIYSTTLILWVPLIVTCVIQMVFSARCSAVCVSFLGLPCCPNRKRKRDFGRSINVVRPIEEAAPPSHAEAPRNYAEPPRSHTESTRSYDEPPRSYTESQRSYAESQRSYAESSRSCPEPQRQQLRPPPLPHHLPKHHQSLPPSERRPLRSQHKKRSDRERQETRAGSEQNPPEQHQLLERGTMERSSFWI
ncbi:transmembrane protein 54-like [Notothenia coriiceps]|uniref:Transmembrane protein 54-like n=1 Tax=Notothenia coriiceps TaxID=8208 RepID=A0A6I9P1L7_9TELE|nr:PREDICTED: transmembrane protein 54-like [Notothenia coriiceps]